MGKVAPAEAPDAYAVVPDASAWPQVAPVLEALRSAGVAVQAHAGGGSMKSQFKRANQSGARWALVFGSDELARRELTLKDLREADVPQAPRALDRVAEWAPALRTRNA